MSAHTNPNTGSNRTIRLLLAGLLAIAAVLTLTMSPAAAIEGPGDILPGGNGPDPEEPITVFPGVLVPLAPTASIETSCKAEATTVTVGNGTADYHPITVLVDGVAHDAGTVAPNQQWTSSVAIAENETLQVEVRSGAATLADDEIHRDCLTPTPGYQILTDCGLGKAHARLTNTGTDTAHMAVQYHPQPYALQPIEPGGSLDWELVVQPNGTVDFTVRSGHEAIGVESLHFDCAPEVPEIPEAPEVPEVPEVPEAPEVPDVPEVPEAPEVPAAPEAPAAPETPDAPPAPEAEPEVGPESEEPAPVVEPEVEGEVETSDEAAGDEDLGDVDGVDPTEEAGEAEVVDEVGEVESVESAEDADDDAETDVDGLAFADTDPFQRDPSGSLGRLIATLLWGSVAVLAVAAALLAWRRRDDQSAALAQA